MIPLLTTSLHGFNSVVTLSYPPVRVGNPGSEFQAGLVFGYIGKKIALYMCERQRDTEAERQTERDGHSESMRSE